MKGSLQIGFYTEVPDKITLNIHLSGCYNNKKCDMKSCQNQLLRAFTYGTPIEVLRTDIARALREDIVDAVCLLGGEPFDQSITDLSQLVMFIRRTEPRIPIYAYSGYEYPQVKGIVMRLGLDGVCCGPYRGDSTTKTWHYPEAS